MRTGKTLKWERFNFKKRRGNRYEGIWYGPRNSYLHATIWKLPRGGGWTGCMTCKGLPLPPHTQVVPLAPEHPTKEAVLKDLLACGRAAGEWVIQRMGGQGRPRVQPKRPKRERPSWLRVVK